MPIKSSKLKSDKSTPVKKQAVLNKSKSQTKVNALKESKSLEVYKSNTFVIQQLEDFSEKIPEIEKMLIWFNNNIDKPTEAIENKLEIDFKNCKGEIKSCTFKVYENIIKKLDKFIEKHNNYKKQDIISTMILEFMDKYK